ncbi:hypothetical protein D3C81_1263740 [compost metagenome]
MLLHGSGVVAQLHQMVLLQLFLLGTITPLKQIEYLAAVILQGLHRTQGNLEDRAPAKRNHHQPSAHRSGATDTTCGQIAQQLIRVSRWVEQRQEHGLAINGQVVAQVVHAVLRLVEPTE